MIVFMKGAANILLPLWEIYKKQNFVLSVYFYKKSNMSDLQGLSVFSGHTYCRVALFCIAQSGIFVILPHL